MIHSISELVKEAGSFKTREEKIEFLNKHKNNSALKQIFMFTYDPNVIFLLPDTAPPWKKNSYVGVEGMLYNEVRRLKIFIKGGGYDNMSQTKRENLFISLLEDIDNSDAELLCQMIMKKPFKGLEPDLVKEVFDINIDKM
jgi:hypothetical protein